MGTPRQGARPKATGIAKSLKPFEYPSLTFVQPSRNLARAETLKEQLDRAPPLSSLVLFVHAVSSLCRNSMNSVRVHDVLTIFSITHCTMF
jgi:hypothetical protein